MKGAIATLIVVAVAFAFTTFALGVHKLSAAEAVNKACVGHSGIETWGGDTAYEAICRDGTAVSPDDEWHWEWPH